MFLRGGHKRRERRRRKAWERCLGRAKRTLLISHGGCLDGVGSAIVTLRALGEGTGVFYVQPSDLAEVLGRIAQVPGEGRKLLIADLSLQPDHYDTIVAACARIRAGGWSSIEWRDHHHKQWEGLDLDRLRAYVSIVEVNADASESGASLQQQALAPDDAFLRALAETIRDRDLWWNLTPDSETLEFALSEMGTEAFVKHFLKSNGRVVDAEIAAAAQRERAGQKAILDRLLGEARFYGEGPSRVGVIYGWLPKNTGLHELLHDHGCQVAVNVRPNGKMSLRSRKEAQVCHLIAREFNGGGHPNASGGDLRLRGLGYWRYVVRRGKVPIVDKVAQASVRVLATGA